MENIKKLDRNSITAKVTANVTFRRNRASSVIARVSSVFFRSGYGYINLLKLFTVPENTQQHPITINNNKYISFIYFNVTNVTMTTTPLKMRLSGLHYLT